MTLRTITILFLVALITGPSHSAEQQKPNVLFIVIDDLNDWISLLDGKSPIETPNLERIASRGMLFTRAYCASPACNPSRVAALTGVRPSTSGVYGNKSDWRAAMPSRPTIMQRFQTVGYRVQGAGKIFHHHYNGAFHDDASFDDFQHMRAQLYPPQKLNHAPEYGSRNTDWGAWPPNEGDSIDVGTTDYCISELHKEHRAPLFLACGIFKPHSPFFAPDRYHQPHKNIQPPVRNENDWNDLPTGAISLLKSKKWFWRGMMQLESRLEGSYRDFIRSYAAGVTFADSQVGRLLDALDNSGQAENTIIVLWSDHGFHLGEKDHIEKFALWEKSNHIPLIIAAPGVTRPGSICQRPVDTTVLYPTLLDLCGLREDSKCDGVSVMPLLRDPTSEWNRPAVTTYMRGNHAIRSDRWRYIRYADGTEELYDHSVDPQEWNNLAHNSSLSTVIQQHQAWLPHHEVVQVPDLQRPSP